jgi:iron complex outermembrane receptor protein
MSTFRRNLFATVMVVALGATTSAFAADTNDSASVSEVIVTAQKRAENIQDVPLSIAAVSGPALAAAGVTSVAGLQRLVPNLRLDTISQAAGVSLRIRGIGTFSNAAIDPSVAPYIDGVFIPRPGAVLSSFLDVSSVEVLRGPQGTLFGRNATVGAISLHTNDPSFSGDSGELMGELGNYGDRKIQGIGNFKVNDAIAIRAAVLGTHTDGWDHNDADGKTYGRSNSGIGRFSVKAILSPSVTWIGRVDYAQTTGDGSNANIVDSGTATPAQLQTYATITGTPLDSLNGISHHYYAREDSPSLNDRQFGASSDLSFDAANGYSVRLIDSYRTWRDDQHDGDNSATTLNLFNRTGSFKSESQSHELQFLSPKDKLLDGRLDFVAGLYYFREVYATVEQYNLNADFCSFIYGAGSSNQLGCSAGQQFDATNGRFNQTEESVAAYGQVDFKITDTIEATLGGRVTRDTKTGDFLQVTNNSFVGAKVLRAPESTQLKFSDSHPNWRANISWHITPDVMAFATYSTGYKSGGFNNNGGTAPLGATDRTFASETSDDIELGVKSVFFDHRLLLNAQVFQTKLNNFQDRSFNGLTYIVRNAGDIRVRGVEAEGQVRITDPLHLEYSVAYLDSIYTSDHEAPALPGCTGAANSCPLVQDLTGSRTNYAPKWQTNLALVYDVPAFANGWTATLRGALNYSSKIYTTNDNNPQSITGGDTLLGARATFVSPDKNWRVTLFGENLTNRDYFTLKFVQPLDGSFGVRIPATGATLMRGYLGAPRTVGVQLAREF